MKIVGLIWILIFGAFAALGQKSDSALSRKLVAPWWVEKFRVSAGFFVPVSSTKIQVSANGYIDGTNIDLNKDLGYNAGIATFITSFQWRISRRSRLTLGYFNMQRSTTHKLQKDIIFDSTTYPANTVVNSYFNTTIYQFSYGYAIVEKPDYEIGIQIGTHAVESKVGITSNGYSAGATISNNFGVSAPLPDLGIWGGFAFSKRLAANLDLGYLSLTINNISGRILTYNMVITYQLIPMLDLNLAYSGLDFKVSTTKKTSPEI